MKPLKRCICGQPRPRFLIVCPECWRLIPRDLRTRIALLPAREQVPAARSTLSAIRGAPRTLSPSSGKT